MTAAAQAARKAARQQADQVRKAAHARERQTK